MPFNSTGFKVLFVIGTKSILLIFITWVGKFSISVFLMFKFYINAFLNTFGIDLIGR